MGLFRCAVLICILALTGGIRLGLAVRLCRGIRIHPLLLGQMCIRDRYMTWLIRTFYDNQKEETTMSGDKRTVAFQVPGELFERFKDYLQEKGIKQNRCV